MAKFFLERKGMYDSYIIKVAKTASGLVIRDQNRQYRFIATDPRVQLLHDSKFATPLAAEIAVKRLLKAQNVGQPQASGHSGGSFRRKAA
jgi:hypothetical protein